MRKVLQMKEDKLVSLIKEEPAFLRNIAHQLNDEQAPIQHELYQRAQSIEEILMENKG